MVEVLDVVLMVSSASRPLTGTRMVFLDRGILAEGWFFLMVKQIQGVEVRRDVGVRVKTVR